MREKDIALLIVIVVLTLIAIWINLPSTTGIHIDWGPINYDREIKLRMGLDLQGGLQVLLVADLPDDKPPEADAMRAVRRIIENRVDALGVVEPVVQLQGERRIIVELPGIEDPELAISTIKETGLLEFIDAGHTYLPPGTVVKTTFGEEVTTTPTVTPTMPITPSERVFETILTGKHLKTAQVTLDRVSRKPMIAFVLTDEGAPKFAEFTSAHANPEPPPFYYLAIVLDKRVISSPHIKSAIPDGRGVIEGDFTLEEARSLAVQLRYGALPIPLKVETTRSVGPTLGYDSIRKSMRAGVIGLSVVLIFMLIYYRLPGLLADLALILYGLLNFAIYKFGIPFLFGGVTLTLPGIAGFLLSTGMAVDANILIFERMKEELRAGRSLRAAIEAGFKRAWTSIRDSNLSTIITCLILYWFGLNFGASMVKGFAITLFIGVLISMFTAVIVTRTLIRLVFHLFGETLSMKKWLLGI
jgi:protein-export membrane protein SecD